MEQNDKIFEQFKNLAQSSEVPPFSSIDKVWDKVEHKLDKKVLKKENKLWKKIAVAASVLLIISITYFNIKTTQKEIITNDKIVNAPITKEDKTEITSLESTTTENQEENLTIKKDADKILQEQLSNTPTVATTTNKEVEDKGTKISSNTSKKDKQVSEYDDSAWLVDRRFDSRGVVYQQSETTVADVAVVAEKASQKTKKEDPIIVVNGEVQKNIDLENEEFETIIHLTNPLYIINGVYYTEQEVFGPNPTSPYSPIKKQKIESITVLEPEKAQKIYGEKGKEGIVIIYTKNGKPKD